MLDPQAPPFHFRSSLQPPPPPPPPPPTYHLEISPHGPVLPTPPCRYPPPPLLPVPPPYWFKSSTHPQVLPPSLPFYTPPSDCMIFHYYPSHFVHTSLHPPLAAAPSPPAPTSGNVLATELARLGIVSDGGVESVDTPVQEYCTKESKPTENHPQPPPPPPPPFPPLPRYPLSVFRRKRLQVWLPRSCTGNRPSGKVNDGQTCKKLASSCSDPSTFSESLEFDTSHPEAGHRTTVMIRNIPNKLRLSSREVLLKLLDKHCAEENEKALPEGSSSSEYDFIYLPIDFRNKCNLGYAFVNFTTAAAACRLYRWLHQHKWNILRTRKISHVCYARIQGKSALLSHFNNAYFECDTDEYLPATLSPPRNGSTSCPNPCPVGRRAAN